jgi:hypothetical protein
MPHGHFGLATEFQHQSRRRDDYSGERMAKMMKIEGDEGRKRRRRNDGRENGINDE